MRNNFIKIFLLIYVMISKVLASIYSLIYDTGLNFEDEAIFYSIGRMLMNGKILYKDTFDHKTPYIYFIYGFASLFKERNIGIYMFEIFLMFIILLFIYKIFKLFDYKYALIVTLLLSLFLKCRYFTQGFFRTETCALAVLIPAIYLFAKFFISEEKRFKLLDMFIIGVLAGFSFMVNIRAVVLFVPFALVVAFILIKNKEFINLILIVVMGFFGVFVSIVPYLIYAIKTNSLSDFYHAVVYTNLAYNTTYSGSLLIKMYELKSLFFENVFFVLYAIYSFIALFFIRFNKYLKISIIFSYLLGLYYILFTGVGLIYYFIIVVPYFSFGIILFINIFENFLGKIFEIKENLNIKLIIITFILIIFSFVTSYYIIMIKDTNSYRRSKKLDSIFKEANIDYKNSKILAVGFQPLLYTTIDVVPNYKYFFTPNLFYRLCPEPFKGQTEYVVKLDPDIIVLVVPLKYQDVVMPNIFSVQDCYRMREAIKSNYELLATYDMDESWGTYQIYVKNKT